MSSRWIIRIVAVAGFVALTMCLTSSSLADLSGDGRPQLSSGQPEVQSFGPPVRTQFRANRRGDDIVRTLLTDRAVGQLAGSPFMPPGRPNGRPIGGNPDPGTPPGQPDDRPPGHSNAGGNDGGDDEDDEDDERDDKDKDKD